MVINVKVCTDLIEKIDEVETKLTNFSTKLVEINKKINELSNQISELENSPSRPILASTRIGRDGKVIAYTDNGRLVVLFSNPPEKGGMSVWLVDYVEREGQKTLPNGEKTKYIKCFEYCPGSAETDFAAKRKILWKKRDNLYTIRTEIIDIRYELEKKWNELNVERFFLQHFGIDKSAMENLKEIFNEIPDVLFKLKEKNPEVNITTKEHYVSYMWTEVDYVVEIGGEKVIFTTGFDEVKYEKPNENT